MFTFFLVSLLSRDGLACINGMFGAKQITFVGFNQSKSIRSKIDLMLPYIYECMIEHSTRELTDIKEKIRIDITLKDNTIEKMKMQSVMRTQFTKEISCLQDLFKAKRFPPQTDAQVISGAIEFRHRSEDKEAFANMQPKALNGTYKYKSHTLKISREERHITYQYSYQSSKDRCQFEYSGKAKIYPVARVMDESGECMNGFTIQKGQVLFQMDSSCAAIPKCFPSELFEESVFKKHSSK